MNLVLRLLVQDEGPLAFVAFQHFGIRIEGFALLLLVVGHLYLLAVHICWRIDAAKLLLLQMNVLMRGFRIHFASTRILL